MNPRRASFFCLLACLLVAPVSLPAHAAESRPAGASQARLDRDLREALARHLAEAGLGASLRGYSLSPAIVQLRRYVDGKQTKAVCIVSLALKSGDDAILAEIRGSASAIGGTTAEALDAAVHSAVSRVPDALSKLQMDAGGRVARR